jgi:hypothetical protein
VEVMDKASEMERRAMGPRCRRQIELAKTDF